MPNSKEVATKLTYREYRDGIPYRTFNINILNPGYDIPIIDEDTYIGYSEAQINNRINTILDKINIACLKPYQQYYTNNYIRDNGECKPTETFIIRYDGFYCRIQGSANIGETIIETYINSKVSTTAIVSRYLNGVVQGNMVIDILDELGITLDQLKRADEGLLRAYESKLLNNIVMEGTQVIVGTNATKQGEFYINADDCAGSFNANALWTDPVCRVLEDGSMNGECFNMNLTITVNYNE
jgi:hypothetical protein